MTTIQEELLEEKNIGGGDDDSDLQLPHTLTQRSLGRYTEQLCSDAVPCKVSRANFVLHMSAFILGSIASCVVWLGVVPLSGSFHAHKDVNFDKPLDGNFFFFLVWTVLYLLWAVYQHVLVFNVLKPVGGGRRVALIRVEGLALYLVFIASFFGTVFLLHGQNYKFLFMIPVFSVVLAPLILHVRLLHLRSHSEEEIRHFVKFVFAYFACSVLTYYSLEIYTYYFHELSTQGNMAPTLMLVSFFVMRMTYRQAWMWVGRAFPAIEVHILMEFCSYCFFFVFYRYIFLDIDDWVTFSIFMVISFLWEFVFFPLRMSRFFYDKIVAPATRLGVLLENTYEGYTRRLYIQMLMCNMVQLFTILAFCVILPLLRFAFPHNCPYFPSLSSLSNDEFMALMRRYLVMAAMELVGEYLEEKFVHSVLGLQHRYHLRNITKDWNMILVLMFFGGHFLHDVFFALCKIHFVV